MSVEFSPLLSLYLVADSQRTLEPPSHLSGIPQEALCVYGCLSLSLLIDEGAGNRVKAGLDIKVSCSESTRYYCSFFGFKDILFS